MTWPRGVLIGFLVFIAVVFLVGCLGGGEAEMNKMDIKKGNAEDADG